MIVLKQKFQQQFPDGSLDEPLKNHCTMHVGGPADMFFSLKNNNDLPKLIKFAKKHNIPWLIIGSGANIIFDDQGFRGLVIKIETNNISIKNEEITADAGVRIIEMVKEALKANLSGLESWISLPGTVGGAVRGNAGCNDLETKDILTKAQIFDPKTDEIKEVDNEYFKFSYRYSSLKQTDEILLSATFKLKKSQLTQEEQKELLQKAQKFRFENQPLGYSSGSFFKNPSPDKSAGRLIEKAGLKGEKIGQAKISEKHANFIQNLGKASSKDIIALAKLAKKTVKEKFQITLQEEVQIISQTGKTPL